MTGIAPSNTIRDIFTAPELRAFTRFLMYSPAPAGSGFGDQMAMTPIQALAAIGWSPEGICAGVNFLIDEVEHDRASQYFIYPQTRVAADAQMGDVNLIRLLPEKPDATKPYVLLAAGGSYTSVCTLVESLPAARHFVEAGYTVFLLTYRVMTPMAAPKALEDMAEAIGYIRDHAETLSVSADRYVVGGFSAGANLISGFGVPSLGYAVHDLPKPMLLMPIYTFVDLKADAVVNGFGDVFRLMFGENYEGYIDQYDVLGKIDPTYPPCYLVCGMDDATVPPQQSQCMKAALDAAGVSAVLEAHGHAPHGFGDGTGTDAEGWPERAIAFLEWQLNK